MADFINRQTFKYITDIFTPDLPEDSWLKDPDLTSVSGVPSKYWKVVGDSVLEMNSLEKEQVDIILNTPLFRVAELEAIKLTATGVQPSQHEEGFIYYDVTDRALTYLTDAVDVALNTGQENWVRVLNETEELLENGTIVRFLSTVSGLPTISRSNTSSSASSSAVGITTHDIPAGKTGFVTTFGIVRGLNTSDFEEGHDLWLSEENPGKFTEIKPINPVRPVHLGKVMKKDALDGRILVNISAMDRTVDFLNETGVNVSQGFYASHDSLSSTTSTALTNKLNLSADTSLVVSGTGPEPYRLLWYYEWAYGHNSNFLSRIQVDDLDNIYENEWPGTGVLTNFSPVFGFIDVTLSSGTHNFDLDYASGSNGKEARIRKARFSLAKLSPAPGQPLPPQVGI